MRSQSPCRAFDFNWMSMQTKSWLSGNVWVWFLPFQTWVCSRYNPSSSHQILLLRAPSAGPSATPALPATEKNQTSYLRFHPFHEYHYIISITQWGEHYSKMPGLFLKTKTFLTVKFKHFLSSFKVSFQTFPALDLGDEKTKTNYRSQFKFTILWHHLLLSLMSCDNIAQMRQRN